MNDCTDVCVHTKLIYAMDMWMNLFLNATKPNLSIAHTRKEYMEESKYFCGLRLKKSTVNSNGSSVDERKSHYHLWIGKWKPLK